MPSRNIDAVALIFLTLLLLVIEAAGSRASAIASSVSEEGWCPRTVVREVVMPMPRVILPRIPRLPCLHR